MKRLKLTEQEIVDYRNAGKTLKEIARLCGVKNPMWQIVPILKKHGLPTRRANVTRAKKLIDLDIHYFKIIDTAEKAYWLGFIYADGCVRQHKVTLGLADKEPIIQFKKAIKSGHKISTSHVFDKRTNKTYIRHAIQIPCQVFATPLISRGVFHNTSKDYPFPSDIPKAIWTHFIRGLIDGDGCIGDINKQKRQFMSLIASNKILNFIQEWLLTEYNIPKTTLQTVTLNNREINKMNLYKDALRFLDLVYKDSVPETRLKRKYDKYLAMKTMIFF